MLDEFVYDPRRAARLRDGVLGQMLDPLTADLHARGCSVRMELFANNLASCSA